MSSEELRDKAWDSIPAFLRVAAVKRVFDLAWGLAWQAAKDTFEPSRNLERECAVANVINCLETLTRLCEGHGLYPLNTMDASEALAAINETEDGQ